MEAQNFDYNCSCQSKKRITIKVACMVFNYISRLALSYLSKHMELYNTGWENLRSSNDPTKSVLPKTRSKLVDRSFSAFGPTVWNTLPHDLKECKSLET